MSEQPTGDATTRIEGQQIEEKSLVGSSYSYPDDVPTSGLTVAQLADLEDD